jgi:hypothetical protein
MLGYDVTIHRIHDMMTIEICILGYTATLSNARPGQARS